MSPPLPRGLSGRGFMRFAESYGYSYLRSSSTHVIFRVEREGLYSICIPDKRELSVGTLNDGCTAWCLEV